jgi:hypothetical protein
MSDVNRAISHDLRSIGSVYTSVIARRPQTITISGKMEVFGVIDSLKLSWEPCEYVAAQIRTGTRRLTYQTRKSDHDFW